MFGTVPGSGGPQGGGASLSNFGESFQDGNSLMQNVKNQSSSKGNNSSGTNQNNLGNSLHSSASSQNPVPQKPQIEPREVGSLADEAKRGVEDVWTEVKQFFSINTWLGIDPENMNPQQQAEAKEIHARYTQLDQKQQAIAKQMYEERMQKKKLIEQEEQQRKQIEAQKQQEQAYSIPSGPQKGAGAQKGNKKQQMIHKIKQDRTTLNNTQGE
ncbi:MAG: hypothetical protein H6772_04240 [Pseudomonadales bacterium]|nr:hypothetical protein [Pseudomonadales bacterium]